MKTILVAIDFSQVSSQAVSVALDFAEALRAKVAMVYVIQSNLYFENMVTFPVDPTDSDPMEVEAKRTLNLQVAAANKRGIEATPYILRGLPVLRILEQAEAVSADLIVMGSHGHGAVYNLIAGSTAQGVLKGAHCPLVLVPSQLAEKQRVAATAQAASPA